MKTSFLTSSDGWKGVVAGAFFSVCLQGSLLAAHIDWDGGTLSTNTTVGGSANVDANWGPSGGGADEGGGVVPGGADDVFLNDVFSLDAVTRTITVDASLTWKSLTIKQSTAPSSGLTTNALALTTSGVTLTLGGVTPLSTLGMADAPLLLALAEGTILTFGFNGASTATIGAHTILAGTGTLTQNSTNAMTLTLNGTLAGPPITLASAGRNNAIVLGPSAVITNTQAWKLDNGGFIMSTALDNQIVTPSQWDNNAITYTGLSGPAANIEAATSTVNPSTNSNYRYVRINFASGDTGQAHTVGRFRNSVQNDGGAPGTKEAVYASSLSGSNSSDSSGGHFLLDLNGQDLYVDRFSLMTSFGAKSFQFVNTALNSTSTLRAIDVTGDTLMGGSFAVMNGSTLEFVGGNWFDTVYNRSVGDYPADSSAVPNSATGGLDVDKTRRWDNSAANSHAAFNHYLGSGADDAGNTRTLYEGTGGALRIVGGDYATCGLILNPIGVAGNVDTTSVNPAYLDDVPNSFTVRANAWQSITNLSTVTGMFYATGHRFTLGTPLLVIGSTQPGGFNLSTYYYVVNPAADTFQLAATAGGAPIVPTSTGSGLYVRDPNGLGVSSALVGLTIAGQTTINGHLLLPVISGASAANKGAAVCAPIFQPTFRVGGNLPVRTSVTVDASADTLTLASGSVAEGDPVWLAATTIPVGLVAGQVYYARDVSGGSFKVAGWPGEPAIDFTSAGTAVVRVTPEMSGTAELTVTGDLLAEGRVITGYIGGSSSTANIKMSTDTGDGTTVTITNTLNHGLVPGDIITVTGGNVPFRGTFPVANVLSPLAFTYTAAATGAGGTSLAVTYSKPLSINVAIQSNASIKVAGNVTIGGVGYPQNCLSTGTGVGISPYSQFTLNGGLATTQTVSIVPPVGIFHVGEGANGVLTGTAANALLATTLTVAGALDVNGSGVIAGTTAGAGIALTNGADLVLGDAASIAVAGSLSLASGSTVDISSGSISVGALDVGTGAVIDFKDRASVDNQLRVAGNVKAQLQAEIAAGRIVSSRVGLAARHDSVEEYSTIIGVRGTMISIK